MTNEQDNKPQKLTLSAPKLSLNKKVDTPAMRQSFLQSRTQNVTVQVKKSQVSHLTLTKAPEHSGPGHLTSSEFHKRLDVVRRAAAEEEEKKEEKLDTSMIGTLSDFGIEMPIKKPVVEEQEDLSSETPSLKPIIHHVKKHATVAEEVKEEDTKAVDNKVFCRSRSGNCLFDDTLQ